MENRIVCTASQRKNGKKYFNYIIYEGKNANFGGKWTPFRPFIPPLAAAFPSFNRETTGLIRRKGTSKCLFPRRHKK